MSFMQVAFNLDTVLGGKYAGRNLTFADGDTMTLNGESVKKPGYEPVYDGDTVLGFIRVEDGGERPTDVELVEAVRELSGR